MKRTNVSVVREIIERELKEEDKVSRFYILELIKCAFPPVHLYNIVIGNVGDDKNKKRSDGPSLDGDTNIRNGANSLFRDCMRCLKKEFVVGDDNWIRRKE